MTIVQRLCEATDPSCKHPVRREVRDQTIVWIAALFIGGGAAVISAGSAEDQAAQQLVLDHQATSAEVVATPPAGFDQAIRQQVDASEPGAADMVGFAPTGEVIVVAAAPVDAPTDERE
jgi:hypothetical protein